MNNSEKLELDSLVESHLNLQVKISYQQHHDFLIRHQLHQCSQVLDVGCGNGTFVARLAHDHPRIKFVGIDKRKFPDLNIENLEISQLDMFSPKSTFDFSRFDGILMRYFLLHVDHAQKILELFKMKCKRPSRFWIIDLDWSKFTCIPENKTFDKLTKLVKDFCTKVSIDSLGGQNVVPLLQKLNYQNIAVEHLPFTTQNIPLEDLVQYLKQEVQCYSIMSGRRGNDPETIEILRFIDEDIRSSKFKIAYGMILVSTELNPSAD